MKRKYTYIQIATLIVALFLLFENRLGTHKQTSAPKNLPSENNYYYVARVVDGDTLKLSDGNRVRLIGVDTPEVHYSEKLSRDSRRSGKDIKAIQELGERASNFTKSLVGGKKIKLEFDVVKHDRYGRLLAYAYLEDGTFVNAKIISEGFGQVMTIPPNVKHSDEFIRLEREARESNRGLWDSQDYKSLK